MAAAREGREANLIFDDGEELERYVYRDRLNSGP